MDKEVILHSIDMLIRFITIHPVFTLFVVSVVVYVPLSVQRDGEELKKFLSKGEIPDTFRTHKDIVNFIEFANINVDIDTIKKAIDLCERKEELEQAIKELESRKGEC